MSFTIIATIDSSGPCSHCWCVDVPITLSGEPLYYSYDMKLRAAPAAPARVARVRTLYKLLGIQHGTRPILCSEVLIYYYLGPYHLFNPGGASGYPTDLLLIPTTLILYYIHNKLYAFAEPASNWPTFGPHYKFCAATLMPSSPRI